MTVLSHFPRGPSSCTEGAGIKPWETDIKRHCQPLCHMVHWNVQGKTEIIKLWEAQSQRSHLLHLWSCSGNIKEEGLEEPENQEDCCGTVRPTNDCINGTEMIAILMGMLTWKGAIPTG